MKISPIVILGGGAWGSALATVLAYNHHHVIIWSKEPEVAHEIITHHTNTHYLPGITFDTRITATSNFKRALANVDTVVIATPIAFLRAVLTTAQPFLSNCRHVIIGCKGIEKDRLLLPSHIVTDIVGSHTAISVISGPTFAYELARCMQSRLVVASTELPALAATQNLFTSEFLTLDKSNDMIGVQVSGAFKNVVALGAGIARGIGAGENICAALITQGLSEMARVIDALGGTPSTAYGLAGVGDLVLTGMGTKSKNVRAGLLAGKGAQLNEIVQELGTLPEGCNTVISMVQLAHLYKLNLPLTTAVHEIIHGQKPPAFLLQKI